ncbi:hypothetical protein SKAU_G00064600 [Synaphobranchus kaupii]|uniref:Uncharacterized protein n=1 Tax=Synaphobranchus kaupii TaxID=118154 RepID=A0A9Q1G5N9_SYNKA|nr:hypothetical protein SKAU_G00064600 [Synaphobranchus kaupii]
MSHCSLIKNEQQSLTPVGSLFRRLSLLLCCGAELLCGTVLVGPLRRGAQERRWLLRPSPPHDAEYVRIKQTGSGMELLSSDTAVTGSAACLICGTLCCSFRRSPHSTSPRRASGCEKVQMCLREPAAFCLHTGMRSPDQLLRACRLMLRRGAWQSKRAVCRTPHTQAAVEARAAWGLGYGQRVCWVWQREHGTNHRITAKLQDQSPP